MEKETRNKGWRENQSKTYLELQQQIIQTQRLCMNNRWDKIQFCTIRGSAIKKRKLGGGYLY